MTLTRSSVVMILSSMSRIQVGLPARALQLLRLSLAAMLVCLGLAAPAQAQKPPNITAGEQALLPPYCPDTQTFNGYGDAYTNPSPRSPYWVRLMGRSFWHMHHFCWGLIKMRRAEGIGVPRVERIGTLRSAVGEFNYVLENATPDFVMLPEVLLRRGDVLLKLGEIGSAMESYEAAVRIRPDYWPAYVNWAQFLVAIKREKEAQAFLERGLAQTPDEPRLRAAYKKAGGDPEAYVRKLPPRPVVPANPDPAASAADAPAAAASAPN